MMRYTTKKRFVEATQYDGTLASADALSLLYGCRSVWAEVARGCNSPLTGFTGRLAVWTRTGLVYACSSDWVVEDDSGSVFPLKPDIFEATYEPV